MNQSIIFVTGLSGAGRSEVMKALEDLDFFCVDNLPLALLSDLSKLSNSSEEPKQRLAVSLDVRGNDFFTGFLSTIDNLEINDEFETSLEDNDGKKVKFLLVENFDANGNNCKKVTFNEPLKLSESDQGTDVTLDICTINNNYEISSINLSK